MASQVESIKRVPGTPFLVDGFRFQGPHCQHYFLTHAHSDHTTGLGRGFCSGVIYCTPITAALLQEDFRLPPGVVRPLLLDETVTIGGVLVTPIDANHCPGSCMFLFKVPQKPGKGEPQVILHTGDLRWHPHMASHPALLASPVHTLILDTTYCAPKWVFPPQEEAVGAIVDLMRQEAGANPATLFVMGSYHIGKERAYLGAAHQLGWRVHCPPAKRKLLRLLGMPPEWLALLTDDPTQAHIHVLGMGEQLQEQALTERIRGTQWERVVAIRPTGWCYRKSGGLSTCVTGCVTIVGVPYSEHSSFSELRDCVKALKPRKIIPTVNATDPSRARALVNLLAGCMDLSGDRSRLDRYFKPVPVKSTHSVRATNSVVAAAAVGKQSTTTVSAVASAAAVVLSSKGSAQKESVVWVGGAAARSAAVERTAGCHAMAVAAVSAAAYCDTTAVVGPALGSNGMTATLASAADCGTEAIAQFGYCHKAMLACASSSFDEAAGTAVEEEDAMQQRPCSRITQYSGDSGATQESSWDLEIDLDSEDPTDDAIASTRDDACQHPSQQPTSRDIGVRDAIRTGKEGVDVDLSLVDVEEQECILAAIAKAREAGRGRGSSRKTPGSIGKLRQGSLKHFLAVQHANK